MKQARHGRLGRPELGGDLGQRPALQVMQLDRPALTCRGAWPGFRPSARALPGEWRAGSATTAGRRASVPGARPTGREPFRATTPAGHRACGPSACATRPPGCGSRSSAATPWSRPRFAVAAARCHRTLVGFQKRLLHNPREIDLVAQARERSRAGPAGPGTRETAPGPGPGAEARLPAVVGLRHRDRSCLGSRPLEIEDSARDPRPVASSLSYTVRGRRCRGSVRNLL